MGTSAKLVTLKLTGAVVIDGLIARAGTLVEMVEDEAKDLLRRGKAIVHEVVEKIEGKSDDAASQAVAAQAAADATAASRQATLPPVSPVAVDAASKVDAPAK
jgi:hypothetical protein